MTNKLWHKRKHSLSFKIGPLTLKRLTFDVSWLTTPFPDLTTDLSVPPVTRNDIGEHCEAAVIEAHPYAVLPPAIASDNGLIRYCSFADTQYLVNLSGTFDDYLKKFAAKARHNLQGEVRRFTTFSNGCLDFRQFSTPAEIEEFRKIAVSISDKTYQRRIGMGFPDTVEFAKSLMADAADGLVKGYILYGQDVPIAYALCRIARSTMRYTNVGYDPEYRKWSPGNVLLFLLIKTLYDEQTFEWLDLDSGAWFTYKKHYSTHAVNFVQLWYFPSTLHNRCIVYAHLAARRCEATLVRLKPFLTKVADRVRRK